MQSVKNSLGCNILFPKEWSVFWTLEIHYRLQLFLKTDTEFECFSYCPPFISLIFWSCLTTFPCGITLLARKTFQVVSFAFRLRDPAHFQFTCVSTSSSPLPFPSLSRLISCNCSVFRLYYHILRSIIRSFYSPKWLDF